jgi:hypothetical protein
MKEGWFMYFFNVKKLSEELKLKTVTQRQKMMYFIVIFFISPVASPTAYIDVYNSPQDLAIALPSFVINILGIYICYKANLQGDNEEFIVRMVCLNLPIIVRLTVLYMILAIPIQIIMRDSSALLVVMLDLILPVIYYAWVRNILFKISDHTRSST